MDLCWFECFCSCVSGFGVCSENDLNDDEVSEVRDIEYLKLPTKILVK